MRPQPADLSAIKTALRGYHDYRRRKGLEPTSFWLDKITDQLAQQGDIDANTALLRKAAPQEGNPAVPVNPSSGQGLAVKRRTGIRG